MVFLKPDLLWGLWALLIPIFIHLFDFRKNKKVYFSDIRFLKEVKHSSSKPLKLKQWLILLARLGFVFFLVMVFAQPTIPANGKKKLGNGIIAIYIDNSPSMNAQLNDQETGLERAKRIAYQIIDQVDKSQDILVITNNHFDQFVSPTSSTKAPDEIAKIGYSDKEFALSKLETLINTIEKRTSEISDVLIISDFQKSTTSINVSRLDTAVRYWLAPLAINNLSNCVVDSAYIIADKISKGKSNILEVVIANYSTQKKKDLPIKIFLGDRQVSAASVTVLPNQKKKISFSLGKIENAVSGYIQLEDYPNTFDNNFYFSIPAKKLVNVFEIIGDTPSPYVAPVFGNRNLFNFSSNNYQNIESEMLDAADFVVLNQVISPSLELIERLKLFASNQGTLLVIPNATYDLAVYQNLNTQLSTISNAPKKMVKSPSSDIPFFKTVLEQSLTSFGMFSSTPSWDWGQDRSAILSYEDETPFLSEVSPSIYFLSSSLVSPYSNFQTHALFVPVMYGLATMSVAPMGQIFNRIEDEFYEVALDSVELKDILKLKNEAIEIIPIKQKIGSKWRLNFPKSNIATGILNIMVGETQKGGLALNLSRNESILAPLSKEGLSNLFTDANVNYLENFDSNKNKLIPFDEGIALWQFALTICLLFLLMETLLIRFL